MSYTNIFLGDESKFNDNNGNNFIDGNQNVDWENLRKWINQETGRKAPPKAIKAKIKDIFEDTDASFNIFETSEIERS